MNIRKYATIAALAFAVSLMGLTPSACASRDSMSSEPMMNHQTTMKHESMSQGKTMKNGSMSQGKMSDQGMKSGLMSHGNTATVATREKTPYGAYLVDAKGITLYMFAADTQGSGKSTCYGKCAKAWPPVLTKGKPKAKGQAMVGLLGTIERKNGTTQVTYNGWPLYYFVGDHKPGDTTCQGGYEFGGGWFLLAPQGTVIHA